MGQPVQTPLLQPSLIQHCPNQAFFPHERHALFSAIEAGMQYLAQEKPTGTNSPNIFSLLAFDNFCNASCSIHNNICQPSPFHLSWHSYSQELKHCPHFSKTTISQRQPHPVSPDFPWCVSQPYFHLPCSTAGCSMHKRLSSSTESTQWCNTKDRVFQYLSCAAQKVVYGATELCQAPV